MRRFAIPRPASIARGMRDAAPLLVVIAIALYAGHRGIDFGAHWDEPERILTLIHAAQRREVLPRWYNYPSVVHDLLLAISLPERGEGVGEFVKAVREHAFLLRARDVFLALSVAAAWLVHARVRREGRSVVEAVVAAAVIGLSWELGYHARWIAPDTLAVAGAALVLVACERARRVKRRRGLGWLAAAATAGLVAGVKYPSALVLLCVAIGVVAAHKRALWRAPLALAGCAVAFVAAFLATTPGALLQRETFVKGVLAEVHHYADGHGGGHAIQPFFPHLRLEAAYVALVAPSPHLGIALGLSALAIVGACWYLRWDRVRAAELLAFPSLYIAYMSAQHVMAARNALVVLPFFAVLAARGAAVVADAAGRLVAGGDALVVAAVTSALTVNGIWIVKAADTIAAQAGPSGPTSARREAAAFLRSPRSPRCAFTKRVAKETGVPFEARQFARCTLVSTQDLRASGKWTANRRGTVLRAFGPREVNLDYYPSWVGSEHMVLLRTEDAPRGSEL